VAGAHAPCYGVLNSCDSHFSALGAAIVPIFRRLAYARSPVGSPTKTRQPLGSLMWNSLMP
jgi:hypothetical protein